MPTGQWYYSTDAEVARGPVSLERLGELIRAGALPFDVLVRTEGALDAEWVEADTVEQILTAIPLDRERLIQEYIAYGDAQPGQENWGWASDRMHSILETIPELAWTLLLEMIERAPSEASLGFIAASPLEDLLSKDGPDFLRRVEQHAHENAKFRRALGMLRRLGMTDEVWRRVQVAAQSDNGRQNAT